MPLFNDSYMNKIEERIEERGELIEERLEEIPQGYTNPQLESQTLHSAKRYRLAICFVDINDFSGYSYRNNDKDTLFMLNLFVSEIMELVRDYDGKLEKNTGDGILAYFGASSSDTEAVDTLFQYITTVKWVLENHINRKLNDSDREPITISIGASYGDANISRIGARSGNQQMNRLTAVSTNANVASLLESMAGVDEYFVGEGVSACANDKWTELLEYRGQLDGYTWGSVVQGYVPLRYYNYNGHWIVDN